MVVYLMTFRSETWKGVVRVWTNIVSYFKAITGNFLLRWISWSEWGYLNQEKDGERWNHLKSKFMKINEWFDEFDK